MMIFTKTNSSAFCSNYTSVVRLLLWLFLVFGLSNILMSQALAQGRGESEKPEDRFKQLITIVAASDSTLVAATGATIEIEWILSNRTKIDSDTLFSCLFLLQYIKTNVSDRDRQELIRRIIVAYLVYDYTLQIARRNEMDERFVVTSILLAYSISGSTDAILQAVHRQLGIFVAENLLMELATYWRNDTDRASAKNVLIAATALEFNLQLLGYETVGDLGSVAGRPYQRERSQINADIKATARQLATLAADGRMAWARKNGLSPKDQVQSINFEITALSFHERGVIADEQAEKIRANLRPFLYSGLLAASLVRNEEDDFDGRVRRTAFRLLRYAASGKLDPAKGIQSTPSREGEPTAIEKFALDLLTANMAYLQQAAREITDAKTSDEAKRCIRVVADWQTATEEEEPPVPVSDEAILRLFATVRDSTVPKPARLDALEALSSITQRGVAVNETIFEQQGLALVPLIFQPEPANIEAKPLAIVDPEAPKLTHANTTFDFRLEILNLLIFIHEYGISAPFAEALRRHAIVHLMRDDIDHEAKEGFYLHLSVRLNRRSNSSTKLLLEEVQLLADQDILLTHIRTGLESQKRIGKALGFIVTVHDYAARSQEYRAMFVAISNLYDRLLEQGLVEKSLRYKYATEVSEGREICLAIIRKRGPLAVRAQELAARNLLEFTSGNSIAMPDFGSDLVVEKERGSNYDGNNFLVLQIELVHAILEVPLVEPAITAKVALARRFSEAMKTHGYQTFAAQNLGFLEKWAMLYETALLVDGVLGNEVRSQQQSRTERMQWLADNLASTLEYYRTLPADALVLKWLDQASNLTSLLQVLLKVSKLPHAPIATRKSTTRQSVHDWLVYLEGNGTRLSNLALTVDEPLGAALATEALGVLRDSTIETEQELGVRGLQRVTSGEPIARPEVRVDATQDEPGYTVEQLVEKMRGAVTAAAQRELVQRTLDTGDLDLLYELWALMQIAVVPASWSEEARSFLGAMAPDARQALATMIEVMMVSSDEVVTMPTAEDILFYKGHFLTFAFENYEGVSANNLTIHTVLTQMSESSDVNAGVREAMAADLAVFSQRFRTSLKILIGTLKFLESRPSEDASADAEVVADLKATVAAALLSDEGLRLLPELGLEAPVPLTGDGKTAPLSGQIKRLVRGAAAGRKAAEVPGGSEAQRGVAWLERQLAEKGGSILAASGEDLTTSGFKMALIEAGRTTVAEARGPIVRLTAGVERLGLSGGRR